MTFTVTQFAAAAAAVALSAPAWAAGTWDFSVCNGASAGTAGTQSGAGAVGNAYSCAANGSTTRDLTVTAWGATSASNPNYSTAYVSSQGSDGFGVSAQSEGGPGAVSPNSALDNDPTSLAPNLILLKFNSAVILDKVSLGWSMNDADLTIMAYTGSLAPSAFINGKSASNLTASTGWSLVQNVGDVDSGSGSGATSGSTINYGVNGGGVSSSYWLISAYNSGFGGGALDSAVDYAKLLSVTTRNAPVPEPASIALAGAALLALWGSRRRAA